MGRHIISLGSIKKKKIIIPLILAILLILIEVFNSLIPKGKSISDLNKIAGAVGEMMTRILPCIFRLKLKNYKSKKNCTYNNFKDYLLFFIFYYLFSGVNHFLTFIKVNVNYAANLKLSLATEFLFMLVLTKFLLKYEYYIHNVLSIIIFFISSLVIDLIFKSFDNLTFLDILFCIYLLAETLLVCYIKYLLNKKKFHIYWNLLFFYGLFHFSYLILMLGVDFMTDSDTMHKKFESAETKYIIIHMLLYLVLNGFIKRYLIFYILDALSPNHVLYATALYDIVATLIANKDNPDKNYLFCLIPNFFQILSLLIYLEILELNMLNLSRNTRRNIRLRSIEEMDGRNSITSVDSDYDIGSGLIIHKARDFDIGLQNEENENDTNNWTQLIELKKN